MIGTASRHGSTVLGRSSRGLETLDLASRVGATAGLDSALRAVPPRTARPGREDRSRPNKKMDPCCHFLRRAQTSAARSRHFDLRTKRLAFQARSGSELAFDDANSSSRTSPRYVSMTFTSACANRHWLPKIVEHQSPSPSGDAFGAGAAASSRERHTAC